MSRVRLVEYKTEVKPLLDFCSYLTYTVWDVVAAFSVTTSCLALEQRSVLPLYVCSSKKLSPKTTIHQNANTRGYYVWYKSLAGFAHEYVAEP